MKSQKGRDPSPGVDIVSQRLPYYTRVQTDPDVSCATEGLRGATDTRLRGGASALVTKDGPLTSRGAWTSSRGTPGRVETDP